MLEYDYLNFPPLATGKHTVTPDSLLAMTWEQTFSTFQNFEHFTINIYNIETFQKSLGQDINDGEQGRTYTLNNFLLKLSRREKNWVFYRNRVGGCITVNSLNSACSTRRSQSVWIFFPRKYCGAIISSIDTAKDMIVKNNTLRTKTELYF